MKSPKYRLIIMGKDIYLREICILDANMRYCGWLNDPLVNQYLESRFNNWSLKQVRDYIGKIKKNKDYVFLAIMAKDINKHIGNVKLGPINSKHKFADLGIMIGDRGYWNKGLAAETIKLVSGYCFKELGLNKVTAGAYANNIGSLKAFKKAGFKIEGLRVRHFRYKNKYVDAVLLAKIKP